MKIKIALILLGVNLAYCSAYAAHLDETPMPVSNDVNVTAPDQSGMWSFGATAVLMQPTNPAFTYADLESNGAPPIIWLELIIPIIFRMLIKVIIGGLGRISPMPFQAMDGM
jgi:hypothetical protein